MIMKDNKINSKLSLILIFVIGIGFLNSCNNDILNEPNLTEDIHYVNELQIIEIAENILFSSDELLKSAGKEKQGKTKKVKSIKVIPDNNNINAFYIINYEDEGFVIMPADKRISPVLAFSETNSFMFEGDLLPSALSTWMYDVKENISIIRLQENLKSGSINNGWSNPEKLLLPLPEDDPVECEDEFEQIGTLLSTIWHQGCGFNAQLKTETETGCTDLPCDRVFAGCVPIAMAQVMRYHESPSTYSWSLMSNTVGNTYSATLLKGIHDVLPISYSCSATGISKDYDFSSDFENDFGYTSASRASYNYTTVKNEIRANRPVILTGGKDAGWWIFHNYDDGHAWVCDGMKTNKYCIFDENGDYVGYHSSLHLHMNWGWAGNADGWFGFNNFDPTVNGTDYTFNYDVKMIYNIIP